jgi:putative tricarboxylic transport membrane protein
MAELPLRRALQNSRGDPMILVSSPISITLLAITVLVVVVPLVLRQMGKGRILAQLATEED